MLAAGLAWRATLYPRGCRKQRPLRISHVPRTLSPMQLLGQAAPLASFGVFDQQHVVWTPPKYHGFTEGQFRTRLPVAKQCRPRVYAGRLDHDRHFRGYHDGPKREAVRADGRDADGVDGRVDDGPPGGDVVRRRPTGCGDDDAVAEVPHPALAVRP